MSNSRKLKLEGTSGGHSFLNAWKSWLHSYTNPKSKSMIYRILRQDDLYHNPDPLFRIVVEVNETIVLVEGQEARALIDSGSTLSSISLALVRKLNLKPQQLWSILQIEGLGWLDVLIWAMWRLALEYQRLRLLIMMSFY